jgi:hypothetical protein
VVPLSEVVIPPPKTLVGVTGGADVVTIEAVLEAPPVGTASLKLIPKVLEAPPVGTTAVTLIPEVLEAPPVGTAVVKLIPEVTSGAVAVPERIGNVTESVAEFKTLAIDESIPRSLDVGGSLDVGAEVCRADVNKTLTSLMMDDKMF